MYWASAMCQGFPGGSAGKESTCNAGDLHSTPRVGKIPWRREELHTSVVWLGEFHGLCSPWGHQESDSTERLSLSPCARTLYHLRAKRPKIPVCPLLARVLQLFFCLSHEGQALWSSSVTSHGLPWVLSISELNSLMIFSCSHIVFSVSLVVLATLDFNSQFVLIVLIFSH